MGAAVGRKMHFSDNGFKPTASLVGFSPGSFGMPGVQETTNEQPTHTPRNEFTHPPFCNKHRENLQGSRLEP